MMATASAIVCDCGVIDRPRASEPLDVDPVGDLEHVRHVVADQDHRQARSRRRLISSSTWFDSSHAERRGRLVEHDDLAAERRGAGHGHRLPLAAGQGLDGL